MKITLQIVFAALIVFLGYQVFQTINRPVQFEKIKDKRTKQIIVKLKDIREAQRAYVLANGKYTGNFDTLENFIKTGYIPLVKRTGVLTDEMLADGIDEQKAIKKGLIKIDTTRVSVMDSLFSKKPNFKVEELRYIPGTDKKVFTMAARELTSDSGIEIPVYEVKAHFNTIFEDLKDGTYNEEFRADTMELTRLKKYIGLKIGSLEEANDGAGNWE